MSVLSLAVATKRYCGCWNRET